MQNKHFLHYTVRKTDSNRFIYFSGSCTTKHKKSVYCEYSEQHNLMKTILQSKQTTKQSVPIVLVSALYPTISPSKIHEVTCGLKQPAMHGV